MSATERRPTACSCGVEGCRELGWPHEWDPLVNGDSCTVTPPPIILTTVDGVTRYWPPLHEEFAAVIEKLRATA